MNRALVLILLLAGCASFQPIPGVGSIDIDRTIDLAQAISESTPFEPPAIYAEWWGRAHAELNVPAGDLFAVDWRVTHRGACIIGDGSAENRCTRGVVPFPGVVVLAEDAVLDEGTVMHEIGHLILGDREHRHPYFSRHCSMRAAECGGAR